MKSQELCTLVDWYDVLPRLGVDARALVNVHGPCPACGGKDRFRFDNRQGRGDWICQGRGGNGFDLLMHVHRWTFSKARAEVVALLSGGFGGRIGTVALHQSHNGRVPERSSPPDGWSAVRERSEKIRKACVPVSRCRDASTYLARRGLLDFPADLDLQAHLALPYWQKSNGAPIHVGNFPALVACVRDVSGRLVTLHRTYLRGGWKLADYECRKLLGPVQGYIGCAVRLGGVAREIGIAEGIETALAARALFGLPVWAATTAALLGRFVPPDGVQYVHIFADADEAGRKAAERLGRSLRCEHTLHMPPDGKDWADIWLARTAQQPNSPTD